MLLQLTVVVREDVETKLIERVGHVVEAAAVLTGCSMACINEHVSYVAVHNTPPWLMKTMALGLGTGHACEYRRSGGFPTLAISSLSAQSRAGIDSEPPIAVPA